MRILFLTPWFPYPPNNGAKVRIHNLLEYLLKRHAVTLIAFVDSTQWEQAQNEVGSLRGVYQHVIVLRRPALKRRLAILGYGSNLPRQMIASFSTELAQVIARETAATHFDAVIASEVGDGTGVAYYASQVNGCAKILDCLETAVYLDRLSAPVPFTRRLRDCLTWIKTKSYLTHLLQVYDACTVPSFLEMEHVARLATRKTRLEMIPHGLDLIYLHVGNVPLESRSLVYNGSLSYFPNKDAVQFFLQRIFPQVQRAVPDARLRVLGDVADLDTMRWCRSSAVEFVGLVRDIRPDVQRAAVSIVPLRYGSGTRLKVIESMALGTPVVSTSKGAEGLDVTHGENILIADDPIEFARYVAQVMTDSELRAHLSLNGRRLVETRYDRNTVGKSFDELLIEVVERRSV